jgi:hypothetical protein
MLETGRGGHTSNDLGSTLTAQQQKGGRKAAEKS